MDAIERGRPLASLLARTTGALAAAMPLDALAICLAEDGAPCVTCHPLYAAGEEAEAAGPREIDHRGTVLEEALRGGGVRIVDHPLPARLAQMDDGGRLLSMMLLPLTHHDVTVAVLLIGARAPHAYGPAEAAAAADLASGIARRLHRAPSS